MPCISCRRCKFNGAFLSFHTRIRGADGLRLGSAIGRWSRGYCLARRQAHHGVTEQLRRLGGCVEAGRIVAVGGNGAMGKLIGPKTYVIDLHGQADYQWRDRAIADTDLATVFGYGKELSLLCCWVVLSQFTNVVHETLKLFGRENPLKGGHITLSFGDSLRQFCVGFLLNLL